MSDGPQDAVNMMTGASVSLSLGDWAQMLAELRAGGLPCAERLERETTSVSLSLGDWAEVLAGLQQDAEACASFLENTKSTQDAESVARTLEWLEAARAEIQDQIRAEINGSLPSWFLQGRRRLELPPDLLGRPETLELVWDGDGMVSVVVQHGDFGSVPMERFRGFCTYKGAGPDPCQWLTAWMNLPAVRLLAKEHLSAAHPSRQVREQRKTELRTARGSVELRDRGPRTGHS